MQLQDKVKAIYYALDEKKANDIVIMDIQTGFYDFRFFCYCQW